jgi:O-methyltransferase involved in polyketide biosynthesis
MTSTGRVSPTAHYTGYVWARNGLSDPALETLEGRILFESLRLPMTVNAVLGRGTLESYLLARHRAIDALLERAINDGRVAQVVEVAAGLSPRGLRFTRRHGDRLTYVEADLPDMVARKRAALERIESLSDRHRVEEVDALREQGPGSLAELTSRLDTGAGLAIITEGLLGYLPTDSVLELWARFAEVLAPFPAGRYISDLHLGSVQTPAVRFFRRLLGAFVRGQVYLHFAGAAEAEAALRDAGFAAARVRRAASIVDLGGAQARSAAHILEASTT